MFGANQPGKPTLNPSVLTSSSRKYSIKKFRWEFLKMPSILPFEFRSSKDDLTQ
jgi:hypothetical protein